MNGMKIKRLSECTLTEAVQAWNEGFKGYFADVSTTLDRFVSRMGKEDLSSELSIVAFLENRPVGFVLNGFRVIDGKKVAWNGGTGVIPEYRGQGVGKKLMEAVLDLYQQEKVELATLEAISANERAISLYQAMGYQVTDRLLFLHHADSFSETPFLLADRQAYQVQHGIPQETRTLPFYRSMAPWQTQWASLKNGEAVFLLDNGVTVGYALYERTLDETGQTSRITLFHSEAEPQRDDADRILSTLLAEVFVPFDREMARGTFNFAASNQRAVELMTGAGFDLRAEQVYMIRQM